MTNPMVNYAEIIKQTNSEMFNVRDEYKNNTVEENVEICNNDRLKFSVAVVNVTGDLNVGMMVRSASLLGAENFYIFGRKKFDKRSTVGAEKYINIEHYVFEDPLNADEQIKNNLLYLQDSKHDIILCEHTGKLLGEFEWSTLIDPRNVKAGYTPLFVFGSESHGLPEVVTKHRLFGKVSIPQRGVLRSFNVSAAMNIICWDYIKEMHL